MDDEIRTLQDTFRRLEQDAAACLGDVHDPTLGMAADDTRTLRQVIHQLTDRYRESTEQLLWTKWGQRIPRSETKRLLADLQGARAQFAAYLTDLRDGQLDTPSAAAQNASARDVIQRVLEEERRGMDLVRKAIGRRER